MSSYKSQINPSQVSNHPANLKNEYIVIPSQSAPSFGGQFTIQFNQFNLFLHDIILNFNTSSLNTVTSSGATFATNCPRINPVAFWCQKIEIKLGSSVIQTLYDIDLFQYVQLWSQDEQHRLFLNNAMGLYSSASDRYTLSSNTSDWYLPLKCFLNSTHLPIISLGQMITMNIYMQPLANLTTTTLTSGTLTSQSMTINSCAALCRTTKMTQELVNATTMMLTKTPTTYIFSDRKYQSFTAQSGINQFTGVLSNITGKIQALYFIVRPVSGLTGDNEFNYTQIQNFQYLDGGSASIVGGSVVKGTFSQTIQNAAWVKTWYANDSYIGVSNSYVYLYAFSIEPLVDITTGKSSGGARVFTGTESLNITFLSTLSSTYQIDVYAYLSAGICLTATSGSKVNV